MQKITRNIILLITVLMLITLQPINAFALNAKDYTDLEDNWAKEYIEDLINLQKVDGYSDNTIRPDNLITRAEFSKMLIEALEIDTNLGHGYIYFRDVRPTDWYYKYVTALKKLSIIDGYDDGTFKPNKNISRAEMIAMLVRVSKDNLKVTNNIHIYKDVHHGFWGYMDILIASRSGLIAKTGDYLYPNEFVTRSEVFYSVDKMLWTQKYGEFDNQALTNFVEEYNQILDSKYNNVESNMDDLLAKSFGDQVDEIKNISNKNKIYNRLGVKVERSNELSNPLVEEVSKNLAKIKFDYKLSYIAYLWTGKNEIKETGYTTYYLKNVDGNWKIYRVTTTKNNTPDKLNLVWDYVYNQTDSFSGGKIQGLDIISPTWFSLADNKGNIESRASEGYVNWAHDNNYKIWALATNSFDRELTSQVMRNTEARKNLINNLVKYADKYNVDGINIDFENMEPADKNIFTEFMNELSQLLRGKGIVLSVDVTVIAPNSTWSSCYDREALAKIVDYVAVMTYDQHWSTSPTSGSVAQLTWVDTEIQEILGQVPSEKVLLGLPFYTRVWKEYNGQVTSKVLSMEEAQNLITENNATEKWDVESGQYYSEYKKDGATYKIWLENALSIDLKSKLVKKYNLAGVAAWREGFETEDVWRVINKNLK